MWWYWPEQGWPVKIYYAGNPVLSRKLATKNSIARSEEEFCQAALNPILIVVKQGSCGHSTLGYAYEYDVWVHACTKPTQRSAQLCSFSLAYASADAFQLISLSSHGCGRRMLQHQPACCLLDVAVL